MGQRRLAREYALQVLFQLDLTGGATEPALLGFWDGRDAEEEVRCFTERLVRGVLAQREGIDARITAAAQRWRIARMPIVDRNVLRVAVFELLERDSPPAVIIDEAIEVAQRFGGEESGGFVNGVLDAIRSRIEGDRQGVEV